MSPAEPVSSLIMNLLKRAREQFVRSSKNPFGIALWVALCVLTGAMVVGCGQGDESGTEVSAVPAAEGKGVGLCLSRAGATFASTPEDLDFLGNAEVHEEVSRPGFVFDRRTGLMVRVLLPAGSREGDAEWIVWYAQPFGDELSPEEIVERDPEDAYVAYIVAPTSREWSKVDSCTSFNDDSAKQEPGYHLPPGSLKKGP